MNPRERLFYLLHKSPLEVSVNTRIRYEPIVEKLKQLKKENPNIKVLEVGSGSRGITRFFRHKIVGADVSFSKYKDDKVKEVVIKPGQKYPFKSNEFDVVVSADTIEHIPRNNRVKALKEMLRVSKKHILLTAPFRITKWDKRVINKWPKSTPTYRNIKEHMDCGIPRPKEIEAAFKGCKIRMFYGVSSGISYFIKLVENNILGKILASFLSKIKGKSRRYYFIQKQNSIKNL